MTDTPKPFSTRECADIIGVRTNYILAAIKLPATDPFRLKAEAIRRPGSKKTLYRVHEDDFVAWLKAINWSRLPKTG